MVLKKDTTNTKITSLHSQNILSDSKVYAPDVHELVDAVMTQIIAIKDKSKGEKNQTEDDDNYELFQLLGKEYLRKLVLETYKNLTSFTAGQEGEVYVLNFLGFKKLLLLKKRLRPGISNEFDLHKTVYEITKNSTSGVKVPVPIDSFVDGNNELILMEFVNGKTLYNLVWPSIIKNVLFKDIEKNIKTNKDGALASNYKSYKERYLKNGTIDFENDSICEEGVQELLFIMFQSGLIKENPGTVTYDKGKKSFPVMEKVYKDNFSKANIFDSEEQKNDTIKNIRQFLDEIHKEGFFHRDLGGNPRNIMFEKVGDRYKVTVIDFGKSEKLSPGSKFSDFDQLSGGRYDNDNDIVSLLNSLEIEKEETNGVTNDISKDIIAKASKVGLELSQDYLESHYDFLSKRNNTLIKVFTNLIEGINKNHGNYIFIKNKLDEFELKSTEKGKKELFIMIHSLNQKEKNKLLEFLNNYLITESKSSNKYKYAKLFIEYINTN